MNRLGREKENAFVLPCIVANSCHKFFPLRYEVILS